MCQKKFPVVFARGVDRKHPHVKGTPIFAWISADIESVIANCDKAAEALCPEENIQVYENEYKRKDFILDHLRKHKDWWSKISRENIQNAIQVNILHLFSINWYKALVKYSDEFRAFCDFLTQDNNCDHFKVESIAPFAIPPSDGNCSYPSCKISGTNSVSFTLVL